VCMPSPCNEHASHNDPNALQQLHFARRAVPASPPPCLFYAAAHVHCLTMLMGTAPFVLLPFATSVFVLRRGVMLRSPRALRSPTVLWSSA